eukprot:c25130_g2_i1 orf=285-569(+)
MHNKVRPRGMKARNVHTCRGSSHKLLQMSDSSGQERRWKGNSKGQLPSVAQITRRKSGWLERKRSTVIVLFWCWQDPEVFLVALHRNIPGRTEH